MRPTGKARRSRSMCGIDAVHGHANIVGATIFPQNIGLGAMRDPGLIQQIGEVTAEEMAVDRLRLGLLADARGRPRRSLGPQLRRLLRGPDDRRVPTPARWSKGCRAAPATPGLPRRRPRDRHRQAFRRRRRHRQAARTRATTRRLPRQLRDIHGAGYPPAIEAGVQAVMASFSRVRGEKMHGNRALLTDVLEAGHGVSTASSSATGTRTARCRAAPTQLRGRDQCRARHVHGARQLEGALREHAGAGAVRRDPDGAARRCGAPDPAREVARRTVREGCALDAPARRAFRPARRRPSIARWRARRCANRWCC